jgi:hypothetical protein
MITIDGYEWPVPCAIERTAEITPSEISGMLLNKEYFNDVLGTWLQYDVTLAIPHTMRDDYDALYESLTAPVDAHAFVMPYNNSTVEITARVESVKDVYVLVKKNEPYWRGVQFTVIANHPTKTVEYVEAVSRGMSPLPQTVNVPVGSVYEYTGDGWEISSYVDVDERYF